MADPRAFVCGHPIAHSRSPLIHRHWLGVYGLSGTYDPVDVAPDSFPAFAAEVRRGAYVGGNVTIPHKEAAYAAVDQRDSTAEAIGAVNTIWREDGRLHGTNTDAYGFATNLDEQAQGWAQRGACAVVLGAGGASRAVLFALRARGFARVAILNRTIARAQELATVFGAGFSAHGFEDSRPLLEEADLLVNTTSLGMHGERELPVDLDDLPGHALVTDIVYVPLETPLLAAARRRGLRTADGLGMLLHQAVPGFERWFGVRPQVTRELRDMILSDLGAAAP